MEYNDNIVNVLGAVWQYVQLIYSVVAVDCLLVFKIVAMKLWGHLIPGNQL